MRNEHVTAGSLPEVDLEPAEVTSIQHVHRRRFLHVGGMGETGLRVQLEDVGTLVATKEISFLDRLTLILLPY